MMRRTISARTITPSRIRVAIGIVATLSVIGSCSTYETLHAGDGQIRREIRPVCAVNTVNAVGKDQTVGTYGLPYYLPKAMFHLTIVPVMKEPPKKASPASAGNENTGPSTLTGTNSVTVNVLKDGKVETTTTKTETGEAHDLPQPTNPKTGTVTDQGTPPPPASGNNPNVGNLVKDAKNGESGKSDTPGSTSENDFTHATSQYVISLTITTVPDLGSRPLYLHYSPNWFYKEEVKVTVNEKGLLTTADATSSDRTAQVIYNLVDTAINVGQFINGGGLGVFSSRENVPVRAAPKSTAKHVVYKKMHVDVTFDPFNPEEVQRVCGLFTDDVTSTTIYVSPFKLALHCPEDRGVILEDKYPGKKAGIYFREPVALELAVIGREKSFLTYTANELDKAGGDESLHAELFKQLQGIRTNSGDHTERFTAIVPNKSRVFAYNIARSAFVQGKQTTLTIADGQLGGVHMIKPSEAEGFSEIPLELSKKLLDIPTNLLTYRKKIITGQGDVLTSQLNSFNAGENLKNAEVSREFTEQTALVNSETAALKAKAAQIDANASLINSTITNDEAAENADIQAEILRLKAEAARLDAETAVLKARAARRDAQKLGK